MSKGTRFCLGLLLPLCVLFWSLFSIQVNADDSSDLFYEFGFDTEEDFIEYMESCDYIIDLPFTLESSDLYLIEEDIQLSANGILCEWVHYPYVNHPTNGSTVLNFGQSKTVTNMAESLSLILYNNEHPLFSSSGVINLLIYSYCGKVDIRVTRGGVTSIEQSYTDSSGAAISTGVSINNNLGDITKIEVVCTSPIRQSSGDYYIIGGLSKYGYILDSSASEDTSKNIFELLKNFIDNFSDTIGRAFKNAVTSAFQSLFVPDEEYLKSRTELLKEQFWDSMGLLAYPVAFLQSLMDDLADCTPTNAVFTFPCIEWEGVVVIPETDFDLYSFFYDNGFGFLIDACRFFTSVVLVGAFLVFCQDTLRRILDDN